ncbi:hypothetical protein AN958_03737, partial [Leucoagaricus sp. SymC.cos]
ARRQAASLTRQIEHLRSDKANNVIPPQLRVKTPSLQWTKDFMLHNPGVTSAFNEGLAAYHAKALDDLIGFKVRELEFCVAGYTIQPALSQSSDGETVATDSQLWVNVLAAISEVFQKRHKDAKVGEWGPPTMETHGAPTFVRWKPDEAVVEEYASFLEDLPAIFNRAIDLVVDELWAAEKKEEKKRQLKSDVEMDVDEHITSQSIQSMIDKRVAAQVKAELKGKGKAKPAKQGKRAGPSAKAEATGGSGSRGTSAGKGRQPRRDQGRSGGNSTAQQQQQRQGAKGSKKQNKGKGKARQQ